MYLNRFSRVLLIAAAALTLALCASCASVSYNRYQTAQTLGTGNMKLTASMQMENPITADAAWDMSRKMDDDMWHWSHNHPGNWPEVSKITGGDVVGNLFGMILGAGLLAPDIEVSYSAGVHDRVDIQASLTAMLYGRFNTKILLTKLGPKGAMSIAPGIGYRRINYSDDISEGGTKDRMEGNLFTAELPLIIGWQFTHVSPYFAPAYFFHWMGLDYTRKSPDLEPAFSQSVKKKMTMNYAGLIAGVQFKWGKFVMTPELVVTYGPKYGKNIFWIYPGFSLGAAW